MSGLKVDSSLMIGSGVDERHPVFGAAIQAVARILDLELVAGCVETREQLKKLSEYNCSRLQGFLFSEAVPGEEFPEVIDRALRHGGLIG
jgi:EAL domain-containing protein (putative c-di-GMP-specific phosphodiesterase class I)